MTGRGLEIDCKDLVELVTDYLEGVLDAEDVERFEDHLALCDGCDVYVRADASDDRCRRRTVGG